VSRVTGKAQTVVLAPARRGVTLVVGLFAVGALALAGVLVATFAWPNLFGTETKEQHDAVVLAEIREMAELQVASGRFETIVDVEKDAKYLPSWVKGERTVLVAEGDVRATVDLGALGEDAIEISEDGKHATVHVPAPQLHEAELDRDVTRVISRDRGLFERIDDAVTGGNPTDDAALYDRAEDKLAEAAGQSDLSQRAEDSATDVLTDLLEKAGFEQVTVVFEAPAEPGDAA
jgi:hypothetical protein